MMEDLRVSVIRKLTKAVEAKKVEWSVNTDHSSAGCTCGSFRFSLSVESTFGPYTLHIRNLKPGSDQYIKPESVQFVSVDLDGPSLQDCLRDLHTMVSKATSGPTCAQILAAIPEVENEAANA